MTTALLVICVLLWCSSAAITADLANKRTAKPPPPPTHVYIPDRRR